MIDPYFRRNCLLFTSDLHPQLPQDESDGKNLLERTKLLQCVFPVTYEVDIENPQFDKVF